MAKILVIEDEENLRLSIRRTLTKHGYEVGEASNLTEARQQSQVTDFDMVLTDVMLGKESGMDLVRELRGSGFDGVLVVMTGYGTVEAAVAAMRDGADDYLQKPLSLEELSIQAKRWLEQRTVARRLKLYQRMEKSREQAAEILGNSPAWTSTLQMADRLAALPLAVGSAEAGGLPCILVLGETGTGKGVLARYIHSRACEKSRNGSSGSAGGAGSPPFVHVNCSALPATLIEAELFGHEKGAFTDAREARPGLFEMADGGTIFLDEIGEMPLDLQSKLLLVVEHGTFRRVGGSKERTVRVRVVAASNQDLSQRVASGAFRRDLLYRLNAFTIQLPPLRTRTGEEGSDAELIATAMLSRFARRFGRTPATLSPASRSAIRSHPWPGNVRELVNCIQRAVMLSDTGMIEPADLGLATIATPVSAPAHPLEAAGTLNGAAGHSSLRFDFDRGVHTADEVERTLIVQALERTGGNVSRAAKLIGMQRSSLRYRIERYHLDAFTKEVARR